MTEQRRQLRDGFVGDLCAEVMFAKPVEALDEVAGLGGLKDSEYVERVFVSNPVTVSCAFGDLVDFGDQERPGAGDEHRAALGPEPLYQRPDVDPPEIPRADVEIDIDMENVLDGVYLWGALVTDRTETGLVDTGYRAFATWDPLTTDTESENFLHFWDWLDTLITSCTRAGASMLAYCWHQAAENTQLRRIARHSPTLKSPR